MIDKFVPTTTSRWDPFAELSHLQRAMNRLFETPNGMGYAQPTVNLYANEEQAAVTAELPGVDPEKLNISVNEDILTISGSRQAPAEGEDITWHRRERGWGEFTRTVELPFRVDADKVKARLKNGILRIALPRADADKPKKIAIEAK